MWTAKIIVFIICLALGVFFLIKTERIVFTVGHNSWAEKYLGPGGSYTLWKALGIIVIFGGLLFILGRFDFFFGW